VDKIYLGEGEGIFSVLSGNPTSLKLRRDCILPGWVVIRAHSWINNYLGEAVLCVLSNLKYKNASPDPNLIL